MQFYTYLHCKPDGTPFYVGKGRGKRSHAFWQRNQHHKNVVVKYGAKNIGVFLFECSSEAQAFEDEKQQIAQLRAEGFRLSNFTDGGEGCSGRIVTAEMRTKIASANRGKVRTPEMCERISASKKGHKHSMGLRNMLGKKHSAETKEKMSKAAMGNKRGIGNRGSRGKKLSIEHRAKLVAAWARRGSG